MFAVIATKLTTYTDRIVTVRDTKREAIEEVAKLNLTAQELKLDALVSYSYKTMGV